MHFLTIGHVTEDLVKTEDVGSTDEGPPTRPGGSVSYASATAASLGHVTRVVTRCGRDWRPPTAMREVAVHRAPSRVTTRFENRYEADGSRRQILASRADPLGADDIPAGWRTPDVLHLAPVIGEIRGSALRVVRAGFVGVTAQGWLRTGHPGDEIRPSRWDAIPAEVLERADAVVVSQEDLQAEPRSPTELAQDVRLLVVTSGADGATAYSRGRRWAQPALSANVVDPTGAGDVFAATVFSSLAGGVHLEQALADGAAAAAYAIETPGVASIPKLPTLRARQRTSALGRGGEGERAPGSI